MNYVNVVEFNVVFFVRIYELIIVVFVSFMDGFEVIVDCVVV